MFKSTSEIENEKIAGERMLTAFFDAKGINNQEFVPAKQTVNDKFYKDVVKRSIARVHCVRPEFQESGSWSLVRDNAPAHSSALSPSFWRNDGSPCYPIRPTPLIYLRLAFLFPKSKIAMKGTRFEIVSSILQTLTRELKAIREEAFSGTSNRCMSDLNVVRKRARTMLSDGINEYFLTFLCGFL
jgi:hypothetical protein